MLAMFCDRLIQSCHRWLRAVAEFVRDATDDVVHPRLRPHVSGVVVRHDRYRHGRNLNDRPADLSTISVINYNDRPH